MHIDQGEVGIMTALSQKSHTTGGLRQALGETGLVAVEFPGALHNGMNDACSEIALQTLGRRAERVAIASLACEDSPRLDGVNDEHIRLLAATTTRFPPIVIQRLTLRVVDGMHRLLAAKLRGDTEILAVYFEGNDSDAFVYAVSTNVRHGLPLSRTDREAAARRIIRSHTHWSDRAIAAATGLSAPTIRAIRGRLSDVPEPTARMGRDGRVRPLDANEGRLKASQIIAERPDMSLREIAKAAGISVGTARDVRERLRLGHDPVPTRGRERHEGPKPEAGCRTPAAKLNPVSADEVLGLHRLRLRTLWQDPSMRLNSVGRELLRMLAIQTVDTETRTRVISSVPEHSRERVVEMARMCSSWWSTFAEELENVQAHRS